MAYPNNDVIKSILYELIKNSPINEDTPYLRDSIKTYGIDITQKHLKFLYEHGHITADIIGADGTNTVYTKSITSSGRDFYDKLDSPISYYIKCNIWNIIATIIAIVTILATIFA